MNNHGHHHAEEATDQIRVAIENLQAVQNMLNQKRPCLEIVEQLSGIVARIFECRSLIAKDHMISCIRPALKPGEEKVMNDIELLFNQLQSGVIRRGSHH